MKKVLQALALFLSFGIVLNSLASSVYAASFWTQSDWSGGSGQTNWSDSTRFSTQSNIDFATAGEIKLSSTAPSDWYDPDWQYRKEITIDPDEVPGSDPLTDFPLLVGLASDTDLAADAQADAADIVFTDDNGTTVLDYEIESFDDSTGELNAWVSVPSVSATANTTLYMYYGNSDGSLTPGNNSENVWGNYGLVLHLNQPSGQFLDSTDNDNNTTTATVEDRVDGQINGAISLTTTSGELIIPDNANGSLDSITDFTLSMWINAQSGAGDNFKVLMGKSADSNPRNYIWYLNFDLFFLSWYNGGFQDFQADQVGFDAWHLITYRRTGTLGGGNLVEKYYIDGVEVESRNLLAPESVLIADDENFRIGRQPSGNRYQGLMDEVRVSTSGFTPEYIAAEFNNQDDPAIFFALGSEEEYEVVYSSSGNLVSSIFDTGASSDFGILDFTATTPASTTAQVKIRTGNASDMSDATAFGSCSAIPDGSDLSATDCVDDSDRYVQYQVLLSTSDTSVTSTFTDISIEYENQSQPPSPPSSGGPSGPPSCSAGTPFGTPDLFQINRSRNSVILYFTPSLGSVTTYNVIYGFKELDERFGSIGNLPIHNNQGVQNIAINQVSPNVEYWFKVIAMNDCAGGNWSNWQKSGRVQAQSIINYRYWSGERITSVAPQEKVALLPSWIVRKRNFI